MRCFSERSSECPPRGAGFFRACLLRLLRRLLVQTGPVASLGSSGHWASRAPRKLKAYTTQKRIAPCWPGYTLASSRNKHARPKRRHHGCRKRDSTSVTGRTAATSASRQPRFHLEPTLLHLRDAAATFAMGKKRKTNNKDASSKKSKKQATPRAPTAAPAASPSGGMSDTLLKMKFMQKASPAPVAAPAAAAPVVSKEPPERKLFGRSWRFNREMEKERASHRPALPAPRHAAPAADAPGDRFRRLLGGAQDSARRPHSTKRQVDQRGGAATRAAAACAARLCKSRRHADASTARPPGTCPGTDDEDTTIDAAASVQRAAQ